MDFEKNFDFAEFNLKMRFDELAKVDKTGTAIPRRTRNWFFNFTQEYGKCQ